MAIRSGWRLPAHSKQAMSNYSKLASGANTKPSTKKGKGSGLCPPWPKGVSGNPAGRPKSKPITDMFKAILDDPKQLKEIRENIAKTLKSKGMAGVILINHMADRVEGKIPDELTIRDLRELSDEELETRLKELKDART